MQMQSCESTNIAARGYEAETKTLLIQFKNGGTYRYDNVPPDIAFEFMNAQSPGRHFHQHIRHNYPSTQHQVTESGGTE